MMDNQKKWDLRFLDMAKMVASWSKDPSTKVGAAIVDPLRRVVSVGYNGLPHGMHDDSTILENRPLKYACTIHAEENALLFANGSLSGCTLYVYPVPPCGPCAAKIRQSGVTRIVYPKPSLKSSLDFQERWNSAIKAGRDICREAVLLDEVDFFR